MPIEILISIIRLTQRIPKWFFFTMSTCSCFIICYMDACLLTNIFSSLFKLLYRFLYIRNAPVAGSVGSDPAVLEFPSYTSSTNTLCELQIYPTVHSTNSYGLYKTIFLTFPPSSFLTLVFPPGSQQIPPDDSGQKILE